MQSPDLRLIPRLSDTQAGLHAPHAPAHQGLDSHLFCGGRTDPPAPMLTSLGAPGTITPPTDLHSAPMEQATDFSYRRQNPPQLPQAGEQHGSHQAGPPIISMSSASYPHPMLSPLSSVAAKLNSATIQSPGHPFSPSPLPAAGHLSGSTSSIMDGPARTAPSPDMLRISAAASLNGHPVYGFGTASDSYFTSSLTDQMPTVERPHLHGRQQQPPAAALPADPRQNTFSTLPGRLQPVREQPAIHVQQQPGLSTLNRAAYQSLWARRISPVGHAYQDPASARAASPGSLPGSLARGIARTATTAQESNPHDYEDAIIDLPGVGA